MALVRRLRELLVARREALPVPTTPTGSLRSDPSMTTLESMFAYQNDPDLTVPRQRGAARRASA
ncbi:MAG TPA: hypothetical protein VFQ11_00190 [Nocardioidaceae bacterium]|nr:hypothetical protein [Nocardioidaceae bacterium]